MQQDYFYANDYQFCSNYTWPSYTQCNSYSTASLMEFDLPSWTPDTDSNNFNAIMSLCSSPDSSLISSPTSVFQPAISHFSPIAHSYSTLYTPFYDTLCPPTQDMQNISLSSSGNAFTSIMPLTYTPLVEKKGNKPTKSKIYDCTLCSRSFARKHDLQRHIRVHTGAKPYYCLHCEKSFARTDALKRHLRMEENCRMSPVIQALKNVGMRRYRNL